MCKRQQSAFFSVALLLITALTMAGLLFPPNDVAASKVSDDDVPLPVDFDGDGRVDVAVW